MTYTPGGATVADGAVTVAKLAADVVAAIDAKAPASTAVVTTDARLSDARTPTAHTQAASTITDFDAAVAATGAVAANTAKVTNATHTGDVTGATALTIANDAVTYAKMQNVSAASRLLGRGSAGGAGDVEELTLGSGLSLSGTTLSASGGSSDLVYAAAGSDVAINSVTDITVVTRDVTSVGATDILDVTANFVILNNSTAIRVYVITLDFDGLFDVEFTTGALAFSATLMHPFTVRGVLGIRSTSLAYATFVAEGQLAAGVAAGGDTTMAATHLRASGWGSTTSDASGTCTVTLRIRSANATATQTCRLLNFQIRKATPT